THQYICVDPSTAPPAPLDTARGPRAAFALERRPRHEPAFRSLPPPPARRPASAGRSKAGVYLAAVVVRRTASPQSIASPVERGAAFARRGSRFSRGGSVSESTTPSAGRADVTVLKFGGTSVADAEAFQRVAGVVHRAHRSTRPVVVVSALAGVTDALLAAADAAASGDQERMRPHLDALLDRHAEIARRLARPESANGIRTVLARAQGEIADLLERLAGEPERQPALRDEIAAYGERLSAALLTAVLQAADVPARYVDARHCLITDETYGRATPLIHDTEQRTRAELAPLLDRRLVPVLGGYIGATLEGVTTTLGRGGSDYSAALV